MQPSLVSKPISGGPKRAISDLQTKLERASSGWGVRVGLTWQEMHPRNLGAHEDPSDKNVCLALGRTPVPRKRTLHCLQLEVASGNPIQASVRSRKVEWQALGHTACSRQSRAILSPGPALWLFQPHPNKPLHTCRPQSQSLWKEEPAALTPSTHQKASINRHIIIF